MQNEQEQFECAALKATISPRGCITRQIGVLKEYHHGLGACLRCERWRRIRVCWLVDYEAPDGRSGNMEVK
ncbi:MAG: hypothetical protein ACOZFS_05955 [Thermodesulfobacteriota bacterium]